jgi:hypothetical protein
LADRLVASLLAQAAQQPALQEQAKKNYNGKLSWMSSWARTMEVDIFFEEFYSWHALAVDRVQRWR